MATPDGFTGPRNLSDPNEFTTCQLVEKVINPTSPKSKLIFKTLPADGQSSTSPISA